MESRKQESSSRKEHQDILAHVVYRPNVEESSSSEEVVEDKRGIAQERVRQNNYIHVLKHLQKHPITSPQVGDFERVVPHLSWRQIQALQKRDNVFIVCPPILIENTYSVVLYANKTLQYSHSIYLAPKLEEEANGLEFFNEANSYVAQHWRDRLITPNWKLVLTFCIRDEPSRKSTLYLSNSVGQEMKICVGIKDDLNGIRNTLKPKTQCIDDLYAIITDEPLLIDHVIIAGSEQAIARNAKILPSCVTNYMQTTGYQFAVHPRFRREREHREFHASKENEWNTKLGY